MNRSPPCIMCKHHAWRQCTREWVDVTDTGRVRRPITLDAKAGVEHPAHYVHEMYCRGTGYESAILSQHNGS